MTRIFEVRRGYDARGWETVEQKLDAEEAWKIAAGDDDFDVTYTTPEYQDFEHHETSEILLNGRVVATWEDGKFYSWSGTNSIDDIESYLIALTEREPDVVKEQDLYDVQQKGLELAEELRRMGFEDESRQVATAVRQAGEKAA